LEKYKVDSPAALTDLVNFVLKSAGCDLPVTEDDINDTDNVEGKLADLQDEYQAVS
jgi:cohesin complex subunit SA-1/2